MKGILKWFNNIFIDLSESRERNGNLCEENIKLKEINKREKESRSNFEDKMADILKEMYGSKVNIIEIPLYSPNSNYVKKIFQKRQLLKKN